MSPIAAAVGYFGAQYVMGPSLSLPDSVAGAERRGGSDYRCVSAVAGPETAVACMWRDDDNVGIVLKLSGGLRGTRRLLWTVHDTVAS